MYLAPYGRGFAANWWMGASDQAEEGKFKWCYPDRVANMSMSSIMKWAPGQPDNGGNNENCVNIAIQGGVSPTNVAYNDFPCSSELKYVCEVCRVKNLFVFAEILRIN